MLEELLKSTPRARERKHKNEAIAFILKKKFSLDIDRDLLTKVIKEAHSLDRTWRAILENNPSLRGADYNDKKLLEDKVKKELGYEKNK